MLTVVDHIGPCQPCSVGTTLKNSHQLLAPVIVQQEQRVLRERFQTAVAHWRSGLLAKALNTWRYQASARWLPDS